VTRRAVVPAFGLALLLLAANAPGARAADASLKNWTSGMCSGVAHWLGIALEPPAPDPNGDEQLGTRRAVSNVISEAHAWMLHSVKVAPPVEHGTKLGARIRRDLTDAVAELEVGEDLLARPDGFSPANYAAALRHLNGGLSQVVETMQRLHGHSGNARLDRAMTKNRDCDYITGLRTVGSGSTA
jgi:hypothetical protein